MHLASFSPPLHSYLPDDITLLLDTHDVAPTSVAQKEAAIQAGVHYGHMLSEEPLPDATYHAIYEDALSRYQDRIASETLGLAHTLASKHPNDLALVSLARAGFPYGVLLKRALDAAQHPVAHYGISIMRGAGIDEKAMRYILSKHAPENIVFVDGWTGKGAISKELAAAWTGLGLAGAPILLVLADPCGAATLSGSAEDWLIPSGLLNGTICGRVSRTLLPQSPEKAHRATLLSHLEPADVSLSFIETVFDRLAQATPTKPFDARVHPGLAAARQRLTQDTIAAIAQAYGCTDVNRIKPGLAEATRAVLRRMPERVLIARHAIDNPDVAGLLHLCRQKNVTVDIHPTLTGSYTAITLIAKAKNHAS